MEFLVLLRRSSCRNFTTTFLPRKRIPCEGGHWTPPWQKAPSDICRHRTSKKRYFMVMFVCSTAWILGGRGRGPRSAAAWVMSRGESDGSRVTEKETKKTWRDNSVDTIDKAFNNLLRFYLSGFPSHLSLKELAILFLSSTSPSISFNFATGNFVSFS